MGWHPPPIQVWAPTSTHLFESIAVPLIFAVRSTRAPATVYTR